MSRSGTALALVLLTLVVGATAIDATLRRGPTAPLPIVTVDLNTTDAAELTLLPGIGPALAKRIVENRRANGPFASLEDLQRVPGIGPRTVERLSAVSFQLSAGEGRRDPSG